MFMPLYLASLIFSKSFVSSFSVNRSNFLTHFTPLSRFITSYPVARSNLHQYQSCIDSGSQRQGFDQLSSIQSNYLHTSRTGRSVLRSKSIIAEQFSTMASSFNKESIQESYKKLDSKLKEIARLQGVSSLVQWDTEVMMKPGSFPARNEYSACLAAIIYEKQTQSELKDLIYSLYDYYSSVKGSSEAFLDEFELANIRDAKRNYDMIVRKTKEMAVRESELEGLGHQIWVQARKNNNFPEFAPALKDIINLKKEIAAAVFPEMTAYDANIQHFERGMKTERLNEIFSQAKARIVPLLQQITKAQAADPYVTPEPFQGGDIWDVEQQKLLCAEIAEKLGFDFDKGRLDVSVHPFTGGSHPTDVRITTRYSSGNWLEGIGGTVHEVGHALYEQGRNLKYDCTPVSSALSMGVHESQSLFWERMIFQSMAFWEWATPFFHKYFPHTANQSPQDFYKFVNQVEAGFIRIEADEVTYPLHIILRFEVEQGLMDGSITMENLPAIWNEKILQSLGLEVPTDAKGVLQDVHWSAGAFGYFPSYSLGAMIAAQLFQTAQEQLPSMNDDIKQGKFAALREWLRVKIHQIGSLYASPDELLVAVTGKPLDPTIYTNYLETKYKGLYGL